MADLHQRRISHYKLTPQAILIGSNEKVKISGFNYDGFSHLKSVADPKLSKYLAPEVNPIEPTTFTPKADVYSLGLIFFELLTLKSPSAWNDQKKESLKDIRLKLALLLSKMLEPEASKRISALKAYKFFQDTVTEDFFRKSDFPELRKSEDELMTVSSKASQSDSDISLGKRDLSISESEDEVHSNLRSSYEGFSTLEKE